MPIIISTSKSVELVSRLLRAEFDRFKHPWQIECAKEVITTTRQFGLHELALEMQNDL